MTYSLDNVTEPQDWRDYHAIRRQELFEARGRHGLYQDNYPDEYTPGKHHYLLKLDGRAVGTTRLDIRGDGTCVFRMVAVTAAAQGAGHGRVLGEMVAERARAFGAHTALVNAAPTAVGYYEKMGWQRHVWDEGELVGIGSDSVQMRKFL
jgi:GNAT superfamily N-acetyltransferase